MLFKTKKVPSNKARNAKNNYSVSKKIQKVKGSDKNMEIKILCDKCFKNVMNDKILYKYGSAVYCKECHAEIEKELFNELVQEYLSTKDEEKEKCLELQIAHYEFIGKEA